MLKHVLTCVDGSVHGTAALQFAADLAHRYAARLTLIHVITPWEAAHVPEEVRRSAEMENVHVTAIGLMQGVAEDLLARAEQRARDCGAGSIERVIEVGDPAHRIVAFAAENGVDLIAMGHRGHSELGEMIGSVSHKVLHHARCACLTVH